MHSFDDDNEMDRLTRSAAEAYQAPGMANWEKMQGILDKEMPQENRRRRFMWWWWFAPVVLVTGIAVYWLISSSVQAPHPEVVPKSNASIKPFVKISPNNTRLKNGIEKNASDSPLPVNKVFVINDQSAAPVSPKENNTVVVINNNNQPETDISVSATESKPVIKAEKNIPELAQDSAQTARVPEENSIATNPQNPAVAESSKKIMISNNKKGWFWGLTAGIDVSTVKYHYASDAGYNIGGLIGYRFNQHLSVQTGGIYTQKNYKMRGADFHPPKGSWLNNYTLETVDGYCKMWELPILATYHFIGSNKSNAFISLGASSYFMKKENYDYLYYINNQPYYKTVAYNSNDQHILALLHLSAGIEKSINKKLTGIVEPYAKIPLSGVGMGSIQLSSFGVNFSVLYKQPKKH